MVLDKNEGVCIALSNLIHQKPLNNFDKCIFHYY